jgi:predicted nucleic acid-binding protein
MQTVVSNTSPIIILAKTGNLNLLNNIFEKLIIPQTVYNEIIEKNDLASIGLKRADFVEVIEAENCETLENLNTILDKGEAEAIFLAKSLNLLLIIDEKKGRKVAQNLKLNILGFLGVLLLNLKKGYISKNEIIEIIEKADNFGYRLSDSLKNDFLKNL